jgi:radical SAM protein with 4Fe4S-binding SPASM domain
MFAFLKKSLLKAQAPPPNLSAELYAYNSSRTTKNPSSLCYAPSVNMYFSQDGTVHLCCHNMKYVIGKYPDQSILEIWNSEAAKKVRKDMEEYKLYEGCNICKSDIEMGAFGEVRARHFDSIPRHPFYPTMMEFLLTNTCNLECIMCKGEFSSLIRQNREKLPPLPKPYNDTFIEQLREFIPYLHETRFSGSGEAFLIEDNYKIWEMIIDMNPNCVIMVQTNGMVLNSRIKDLLKRGKFQIGVSLDSLKKDIFETIRPHAKLERVMENIQYFSEYAMTKKIKFSIALCVMRQNWQELPDFIKFANSLSATATFHKVFHPLEYSLKSLSRNKLSETINYLEGFSFDTNNTLQKQNEKHYQYILDSLRYWHQEAAKNLFEDLSDEQLVKSILKKWQLFAEENKGPIEIAPMDLQLFETKLTLLLAKIPEADIKRKTLTLIYASEFNELSSDFNKLTIDELLSLSQKYIKTD